MPRHPWVSGTDEGISVPRCAASPVTNTVGTPRAEELRPDRAAVGGQKAVTDGYREAGEGRDSQNLNKDSEGVNLRAISLAADSDEWSAMLVSAGLVRSLVNLLQACLDARIAARGVDFAATPTPIPGTASSKGRRTETLGRTRPDGEATSSEARVQRAGRAVFEVKDDGCLGCELETAQVKVMLAIGALLTAHPLAARDRFQLAGGAQRFCRVVSWPNNVGDEVHACVSRRDWCAEAAATVAFPFLREHCFLVLLQVLRLCLRASVSEVAIPPDVVAGAARLMETLSPALLSLWEKHDVANSARRAERPRMVELGAPGGHQEDSRGGENNSDSSAGCCSKRPRNALSRTLLPLRCPDEVPVQPTGRAAFVATKDDNASAVEAFSNASHCRAGEVQSSVDALSYLLCG